MPTPPKPAGVAPAPPKPAGGPPKPVSVAPAPAAPAAKTVPLTQPVAAATAAAATAAVAEGAGAVKAQLPKATVKLQPTQPLAKPTGTAVQSAPVYKGPAVVEEDDDYEGILNPLAAIAVVLAAVLLLVQLFSWPSKFSPGVDNTPGGETWKIPKIKKEVWQDSSGDLKDLEVK